eukprot:c15605_g1_i1.p1 GENE.c15605_g1_i1~~c15605_g1_i1.p1  ORF type:complete len:409 (-),score=103.25 c15605_g1_i1:120-1295(-)
MTRQSATDGVIASIATQSNPSFPRQPSKLAPDDETNTPTPPLPLRASKAKRRWAIVKKIFQFSSFTRRKTLLPPQHPRDIGKKTLVLDLDETLVHASFDEVDGADFVVPVRVGRQVYLARVKQRPHVTEFLEHIQHKYEVVVFTASLKKYANPVINKIDPAGVVQYRLFRESCVLHEGAYVKDLSRLGRDLAHTLIIDNAPVSYLFHPHNAIPCTTWLDDRSDTELLDFLPLLDALASVDDVVAALEKIGAAESPSDAQQAFRELVDQHKSDHSDNRESEWTAEHMHESKEEGEENNNEKGHDDGDDGDGDDDGANEERDLGDESANDQVIRSNNKPTVVVGPSDQRSNHSSEKSRSGSGSSSDSESYDEEDKDGIARVSTRQSQSSDDED